MRSWNAAWAWLLLAIPWTIALGQMLTPAHSLAMPFASPTPDPNTINQPFVTFQKTSLVQRWFRFDSGVPIFVTILILVLLLGLASFYIRSSRPRH